VCESVCKCVCMSDMNTYSLTNVCVSVCKCVCMSNMNTHSLLCVCVSVCKCARVSDMNTYSLHFQGLGDEEIPPERALELSDAISGRDVVVTYVKYGKHGMLGEADWGRKGWWAFGAEGDACVYMHVRVRVLCKCMCMCVCVG